MKSIIKLILLVALVLSVSCKFSAEQQTEILKAHNDYRSKEGASNMLTMTWDDDIATQAQKYADSCKKGHSGEKGFGENLFMSSGSKVDATKAVTAWFDEKKLFKWPKGSPVLTDCAFNAGTGHYTQVVWANSNLLGCGQADCSGNDKDSGKNTWDNSIVCQYKNAGNMSGNNIWLEGKACSKCPDGWGKCENNMCTGSTKSGDDTKGTDDRKCDDTKVDKKDDKKEDDKKEDDKKEDDKKEDDKKSDDKKSDDKKSDDTKSDDKKSDDDKKDDKKTDDTKSDDKKDDKPKTEEEKAAAEKKKKEEDAKIFADLAPKGFTKDPEKVDSTPLNDNWYVGERRKNLKRTLSNK